MRYILCVAFLLFSAAAYSQIDLNYINRVTKPPQVSTAKKFLDKQDKSPALKPLTPSFEKSEQPDPTRNNYAIRTLRFYHNNRRGFDVYASPAHNMPVLVPDSANTASLNMKTAVMPLAQKRFGIETK
jgi:hypothetical protein